MTMQKKASDAVRDGAKMEAAMAKAGYERKTDEVGSWTEAGESHKQKDLDKHLSTAKPTQPPSR